MKAYNGILILFQLFFVNCNDKQLEEKVADYYYQYEYVNHAWGFNHSGFTISPAGEVFSFDKTTPWMFAENNKLSNADLKKNIAASVKVDTLINRSELDIYNQLAFAAKSGKLSEPVQRGADMGEIICKIFVPDNTDPQNSFNEVILTKNGDFDQYNLAPESAVIAEWLSKLKIH